ncbi:hypothetical protein AY599_18700 [Leptolyngbya valderiana BDU 20041]|nr:choice-of-anchor A family protein [Geitlerinema sp. CS-897]OAB61417.1 hypothetical protein AY599_18700 [Leptolyngbya valderiana BDU 20041]PPT10067.1 PPE-repeat protein [Geitlerinema sp. FC II]
MPKLLNFTTATVLTTATAASFLVAPVAIAGTLTGAARDYNLFLFEDWEQKGGDVEGRAAVGGNATLQSVGIADRLTNSNGTDDRLIVGGDLEILYNSGQVFGGNAVVGGSVAGNVNYNCSSCSTQSGSPIDFAAAQTHYKNLSDYLFGLSETGSQTLVSGSNQLQLTGSGTGTHVFNVNLSNVREILLNASSSSELVVINVRDTSISNQITSFFHQEANSDSRKWENVIWNFNKATNIDITNGVSWRGTILAPDARLTFANGNVEGQTIAKSAQLNRWSGEFHNYEFNGKLPVPPAPESETQSVPEPSTAIGLLAIAGLMKVVRRRDRTTA